MVKVKIRDGLLATKVFEPEVHIGDAILIHGFTGSKEDFSEIGPLLAKAGFRVVTSDNRGQYESDHSERDDAYTIASLAQDQLELANHFGLTKPQLFGHSFGGLVAQRAAVEYPAAWSSLTIFCSGPHGRQDWDGLQGQIDFLRVNTMADLWTIDRAADNAGRKMAAVRFDRWHASDKRSVLTHAEHLLSEPSVVEKLAVLDLPVNVIRGENDDAWPHDMQAQMASDLGVEVQIVSDAGHCPNENQPEATAELVAKFWKSVLE